MCSYTGLLHLVCHIEDTLVGWELHVVSGYVLDRLRSLSTKQAQKECQFYGKFL